MNKYIWTAIVLLVILLGIQQYLIWSSPPKEDILLQKITELEYKIDSLNIQKDSIRKVVDSTHVKIVTNEKYYQERINTIMLQSSSADSSFLSDYIRQYASKNNSTNIQ